MLYAYIRKRTLLSIWAMPPHVEVTARAAEVGGNGKSKRVYEIRYTEDGKIKLRFVTRYYSYEKVYLVYNEEQQIKKAFQKRLIRKSKEHGEEKQ